MPTFAKRAAADSDAGARFALIDTERSLSWEEVDETLNRCANLLIDADLGTNRRVAIFAENAAEVALAHLGALLSGASSVPVNFHLTAEEAAYILTDSEAAVLFVGPETVERGLAAAKEAGIATVIGWGCADHESLGGDLVDWNDWLSRGDTADPPDDIAPKPNLLYTSGTTGRPKGTELPPTMFAGGETMAEHLAELAARPQVQLGTHLVVGPMYHTGPLAGMRLLAGGQSSVILGKFDAETTLAAIDRHKIASATMVPTHFVRLLALPAEVKSNYDVSSMKMCACTGARLPVDVMGAMIEWFGPVFRDAYGATEVGTVCTISSPEWLEHPGSIGQTVPPFTALVLDEEMTELPAGTEGRLYFRDSTGRGIIYPNDAEKTAASNPEPGLFTLGEIGYMDADGYVFVTDRFSDMVVSGGVNLYPAEAEQLLIDHPAVADVACIGVPHPEMGEELRALVIAEDPSDPPTGDDLGPWLRERLSHYKCPRSYEVVPDLGRNTMGKINKRRLRDSYLATIEG
jgi:acyl-CoA synthetase (AMP-forming)/AMP-acid ligase II